MQRFKKNIAVMLVFCMSVMLFSACPTTIAQTTDLQIDQTEQIEPMTPEQALLMSSSYPQTTSELTPVEAKTNVANVAVVNYDVTETIRHELSHNLGASHERCDDDSGSCILKENSNTWCATCAQDIG